MGNVTINKILLTGGTGFVGSHLLEALINSGYKVVLLKRANSDTWRINHLANQYKSYDIDKLTTVEDLFQNEKIEGIIHTATDYGKDLSLSEILKTNVIWPLQLLEGAISKGLRIFINTDTFFCKNQNNYAYLNNYTYSKRLLKEILDQFSKKCTVANLQIEHVYGEKDGPDKFVTKIGKQLVDNVENIDLTSGTQKRDFVYIKDVVNAYLKVLENFSSLAGFTTYEVGTGNPIPIREFVENIHLAAKASTQLSFGTIPMRQGEFETSSADTRLLQNIGWSVGTTLKEGVANTVAYLSSEKNKYGNC